MRRPSRSTVTVHLRRGLQLAEEPHHGWHPVKGLAVHVQNDVASPESQPLGRPGRPHLRDHESIDHPLPAYILPVPGSREGGIQKLGQVRDSGLDRFSGQATSTGSGGGAASWTGSPTGGGTAKGGATPGNASSSSLFRFEILDDDSVLPDLADLGHVAGTLADREDALPPWLGDAANETG